MDIFTTAILETQGEITQIHYGGEVTLANDMDIFTTAILESQGEITQKYSR